MFIKILTPNSSGKIELTTRDLEALIEEAVEKAIREKCAGCTRAWQNIPSITYLENQPINVKEPVWDPYKITCNGNPSSIDEMTICLDSTLTTNNNRDHNFASMVNTLCNEHFNNSKRGNHQ